MTDETPIIDGPIRERDLELERKRDDRAREAAAKYARMSTEEKCVFAGELIYARTYARTLKPESVDRLLTCVACERQPSERLLNKFGNPLCTKQQLPGAVCKPRNVVTRIDQTPPWVLDPERFGGMRVWTEMGGRGSGKSLGATGWFVPEVLRRFDYRMGVLGPDFGISVVVGITGPSGFKTRIESFDPSLVFKHDEQKNVLYLANGSRIKSLSTENLKTIEGPEYHGYWADELAELRGQGGENDVWVKRARPGVRLVGPNGEPTRAIMSGTPEATWLIKWLADQTAKYPLQYGWSSLKTRDNEANIDDVEQQYEEARNADGSLNRYGQMKLEGNLILESPHALLCEEDLAPIRVGPGDPRHREPADFNVVRVYVDSNHSSDKKSDECGILVAGSWVRDDGRTCMSIIADASIAGGPKAWGQQLISVLKIYDEIDELVYEDDKSLVDEVLEKMLVDELEEIGRPIKLRPIHHRNRSKKKRADPTAVGYQKKRVLHDGCSRTPQWADFTMLEWQWVSWNPKDASARSPDRLDTAAYAGEDLLIAGRETDTFHAPIEVAGRAPDAPSAPEAERIAAPQGSTFIPGFPTFGG